MQQKNWRHLWWELGLNVVLLALPLFLIIEGFIGMAENDPFHPDVFVLFGVLLMGILSLGMLIWFGFRLHRPGWHRLPNYERALLIFYALWFILGLVAWLAFTEVIPPTWFIW
ncbi:hypothetical protein [Levilactobacillus cerevisiae]|uniref:hypothetical protein n=1 Tax=Levilactobacillus cerevisiae TaxID=1704076 RepID=UPI000F779CFA|nr:hypothetical protein [Levilactobacillus cerevisiae]